MKFCTPGSSQVSLRCTTQSALSACSSSFLAPLAASAAGSGAAGAASTYAPTGEAEHNFARVPYVHHGQTPMPERIIGKSDAQELGSH